MKTSILLAGALLAGCTGPSIRLDNPSEHRCFVDGRLANESELPFRYYGTHTLDVLPADSAQGADFSQRAERRTVSQPTPVAAWLFPIDLPLELIRWTFVGEPDLAVTVEAVPVPPAERAAPDWKPEGLDQFTARAREARVTR